jgi:hypothetical protein
MTASMTAIAAGIARRVHPCTPPIATSTPLSQTPLCCNHAQKFAVAASA